MVKNRENNAIALKSTTTNFPKRCTFSKKFLRNLEHFCSDVVVCGCGRRLDPIPKYVIKTVGGFFFERSLLSM